MIPTDLDRQISDMLNLWQAWATNVKVTDRWCRSGKRPTKEQIGRAAELRWEAERRAVMIEKELGLSKIA
jgi:hypothetical protein